MITNDIANDRSERVELPGDALLLAIVRLLASIEALLGVIGIRVI